MDAIASPSIEKQAASYAPEQSLIVACLLTISGGFLDVFTWLSLGGVFANAQTGNVVFLGMYAATGQWLQAAHHIPPILAYLAGASAAISVRAPKLNLAISAGCLALVMLTLHRFSETVPAAIVSFGIALQAASFRTVRHLNYLSITVTGNMFRAIDLIALVPNREALLGARTMIAICLAFLAGTALGAISTNYLQTNALAVPIGLQLTALWICCRRSGRGPS